MTADGVEIQTRAQLPAMNNDTTTLTCGMPEASATEVIPRARRRRFPVTYKLRILREADECTGSTAVGALLREEGLYSPHLFQRRKQHSEGRLMYVKRDAGRLLTSCVDRRGLRPANLT